ncbi:MAG: hypothetical protein C0476_04920, partial [Sphingomonas sp.]|nr:hypothetical protein [Sphingomonas sp.]
VTERELVFVRRAQGFAVTVTIVRADPDASESGAMFGAAMAGLRGQPIVFQLDAEGRLVAIDDEANVWTRLCNAIAAMASGANSAEPQRRQMLQSLVAGLEKLPSAQRRAILGSMIEQIVAGPLADRQPGTHAITRPARAPGGIETVLSGNEVVTLARGALVIDTDARGTIAAATAPHATPPAEIALSIRQRVDAARGLVLESRTERATMIGAGAAARRARSVVTHRIFIKVS